jgi:DNA-binding response OmpR family regulator/two-component sensor histidine kinase
MSAVLIVDDSITVRMNLAESLESAGLVAVPCATIAEAREALASNAFSLIVLDVVLPDGDGVEFLGEIRKTPAGERTQIMLLSSENEVRDRVRGLSTGADEYIGKPYDAGYVVARARELLGESQRAAPTAEPLILVIDDSLTFREELSRALREASYNVVTAQTGEEGLRVAAHARPSAIVVDGMLPGIDGAGVIRRIRLDANLRATPCLFITAASDRAAEIRALDAGADAFVRKDEEMDVALARLAVVLRGAEARGGDRDMSSLLGTKKILVVDQDTAFREHLVTSLREEGYELVLARSGEEALELLAVEPVDCLVLDSSISGIGGDEVCRRVKGAVGTRDVPIVMFTGLEDREAMIRGFVAGADDYVSRSDDAQVLKARVRAQLRRKHFADENRRIREDLVQKELEAAEARAARELAETRAALVSELELKNRELEAFSYSVSHDLRAPLRRIDGFSAILVEEYSDKLDGTGIDYLTRVRGSAQRMSELIEDMLRLSQITRAALKIERIDLSALASSVASEIAKSNPDRDVRVEIEPGLTADADPRLLRAVFENVFGNAWKFTAKTESPVIAFGAERQDGEVSYFVRDNGVGFDVKHATRLFTPFQRLHTEEQFPGTGIGLATVRRIIDRHGGKVTMDGEVGRGATVRFTLRRRPS